jgi:hypothetical protein
MKLYFFLLLQRLCKLQQNIKRTLNNDSLSDINQREYEKFFIELEQRSAIKQFYKLWQLKVAFSPYSFKEAQKVSRFSLIFHANHFFVKKKL